MSWLRLQINKWLQVIRCLLNQLYQQVCKKLKNNMVLSLKQCCIHYYGVLSVTYSNYFKVYYCIIMLPPVMVCLCLILSSTSYIITLLINNDYT